MAVILGIVLYKYPYIILLYYIIFSAVKRLKYLIAINLINVIVNSRSVFTLAGYSRTLAGLHARMAGIIKYKRPTCPRKRSKKFAFMYELISSI